MQSARVLLLLLVFSHGQLATAGDVALDLDPATQTVEVVTSVPKTVSVSWDKIVQAVVVETNPGPTLAADAYGTMHTAMFDAWSRYDSRAVPVAYTGGRVGVSERTTENKACAMSWAAFRVIKKLFPEKADSVKADAVNDGLLDLSAGDCRQLGVDVTKAVLAAYEVTKKTDPDDMLYKTAPFTNEVDRWTAEHIPIDDPEGPVQSFLTPKFGRLRTFGIENGKSFRPAPPQPFLLEDVAEVNVEAGTVTFLNDSTVALTRSMIGPFINEEFINQAEEIIEFSRNLDDETKLIAEFWEDGGGSSFPPGTWMTFGQYVSARDDHNIDDDAQMFLILGNAVRDAGIASWNAKAFYFYARPVRAIRDLGKLGLIGSFSSEKNGFVIVAYNQANQQAEEILATEFTTFQLPGSNPSPPFPEYTSGHSAFSAAAAVALKRFTGSDNFGASVTFLAGSSRFEPGVTPENDLTFTWQTFRKAANKAGVSRLHGGIHFEEGDKNGRALGRMVGRTVFEQGLRHIKGCEDPYC